MDTPPLPNTQRRIAALLEVLGIYLAGGVLISLLLRALAMDVPNPLARFRADITDAELLAAAGQMTLLLLLQYAGWFLLIIPINAWHRRRGPAAYGLTRAAHSWTALALAGLGTAALAAWPVLGIGLVDTFYDLGETAPWRQAFFDTSWRRGEFWLFSGVLSWGLVAFLEELFFRGYCQRRLAEDWGDAPAIVGTSCLFVFAHSQYLNLDAYNLGMVFSLFCLSISFGVAFAWTRSIVPSFVAHALINVPMTPFWQGAFLALFVVGWVFFGRRGMRAIRQVFSHAAVVSCLTLALIGAGWAVLSQQIAPLRYVAVAMVIGAVVLHLVERRRLAGEARLRAETVTS